MTWFSVYARGHHGYPQPEDSYQAQTYSEYCPHCGIHGEQVLPFRIKQSKAPSSHFLQLNWCFDAFFVSADVPSKLTALGLTGASFGPAIDHRTGDALASRLQLLGVVGEMPERPLCDGQ